MFLKRIVPCLQSKSVVDSDIEKYVDDCIEDIVQFAREYNVDGRRYGKTWRVFLRDKMVNLGHQKGIIAIDKITQEIKEYIKIDFLGRHITPTNQWIKRHIERLKFK